MLSVLPHDRAIGLTKRRGMLFASCGRLGGANVIEKALLVLLLGGAVFSSSPRLHATERLRVHASPASSSDITIYIGVERHADNRLLRVTAESSDFYRGSE